MGDGIPLTPRERRAWTSYQRMSAALQAHLQQSLHRDCGLSLADYEVLFALYTSPEGRLRALDLRCALGWEKSRLSHQIRRMAERGLLCREPNPADARSAVVCILDKGRKAIEKAAPEYLARLRADFLNLLTPAQLDALTEISETVLTHLIHQEHEREQDGEDATGDQP
ncbi:MarR family winged helix-turn-helix transcriptional regulator [Thermobispora bispora]|uniref:Transcriptional regulator, MarR family n=1 Tax=Thermobispora bispora (strain ATCC 19993 / DSM 43833 / CBS 139.67 / JCM 10125 / KCTC 9307 / NBRC 14880 / R51) TaxID=469371 RepID=D6Y4L1_THEBD|nr:MarR family winged helix-turn-helix transcriptional regulator [Thermobispora bispora]ADG89187.1 transcriptional regulator, MarR family [Thermobispora bispora DSM 43833]